MIDILDSASLRYGDCFAVPLRKPGRHRYAIVLGHGRHLAFEHKFEIEVSPRAEPSDEQIDVAVSLCLGRFAATPSRISVRPGTLVCWTAAGQDVPGFAIVSEDGSFASDPLSGPSVYIHRFLEPGSYKWMDRNGRGPSGTIEVTSPQSGRDDLGEWQRHVQQAAVVEVGGRRSAKHRAVVGQPVVFVIDDARGITISDERYARLEVNGGALATQGEAHAPT